MAGIALAEKSVFGQASPRMPVGPEHVAVRSWDRRGRRRDGGLVAWLRGCSGMRARTPIGGCSGTSVNWCVTRVQEMELVGSGGGRPCRSWRSYAPGCRGNGDRAGFSELLVAGLCKTAATACTAFWVEKRAFGRLAMAGDTRGQSSAAGVAYARAGDPGPPRSCPCRPVAGPASRSRFGIRESWRGGARTVTVL